MTDLGACRRESASLVSQSETGEIAGDVHRFTLTSEAKTLKVVELKKGESQPSRAVAVKVSASTASPTPLPLRWYSVTQAGMPNKHINLARPADTLRRKEGSPRRLSAMR